MLNASKPETIADVDEALAIMSAELQVAEIQGDDERVTDIKKFMDHALDLRLGMTRG